MLDIINKPVPVGEEEEAPPPILPTLIDWMYVREPINCIIAHEIRDHPRLGSFRARPGEEIITSKVRWINRDSALAQTENRLYRLERELK